ncbi:hypothetical protein PybrP1_007948 [[Pythium] brassicae (nom. inval.)]|nr:hypothetical protein PybrP1_007948 [[Pythium] brassicae (nom. inval.)]
MESLRHIKLQEGERVLDVGASPGGWTESCSRTRARSWRLKPFAMRACDNSVRMQGVAALIASTAPLLRPGARVLLALKLEADAARSRRRAPVSGGFHAL